MKRSLQILALAVAFTCAGHAASWAQQKTDDRLGVCAKYQDAAKKEACQKRLSERLAERKAKQDAARKELRERLDAACAGATDKAKCAREETAKLKKGKAKAREKAKKGS